MYLPAVVWVCMLFYYTSAKLSDRNKFQEFCSQELKKGGMGQIVLRLVDDPGKWKREG